MTTKSSVFQNLLQSAKKWDGRIKNIVVLTGAGISAESGIPTFRGATGLWENISIEKVATPEGFQADPALVQKFYSDRRRDLQKPEIQPNAAHLALAKAESLHTEGSFLIVTQNIDDLHERAGSKNVLHMHGELLKTQCTACHGVFPCLVECTTTTACTQCQRVGTVRPYIVWFGEIPRFMEEIEDALSECDLFVAIGSSGQVYPAAGFARTARRAGAYTVEVNLEPTAVTNDFAHKVRGPASVTIPQLVAEWFPDKP